MGAKHSKNEEVYVPDTPSCGSLQSLPCSNQSAQTMSDPRSPSGLRTPIVVPSQRVCTTIQLVPVQVVELIGGPEKPLDALRKKLLKGFINTDPRSPSLNRTPLYFDDYQDKTLDLDDTFADLFVENNSSESELPIRTINEDKDIPDCSFPTVENSPIVDQNLDPRSPSFGVERTPIILCDDETDANEEDFLENMLSTLTLNLNASTESSFVSLKSSISNELKYDMADEGEIPAKPFNKHLDRVLVAKKNLSKGPHRRRKYIRTQKIYEDCENDMSIVSLEKCFENHNQCKGTRTPLSCMRNRSQLRSRSVESSTRTVKSIFPLKSFDDNLISNGK